MKEEQLIYFKNKKIFLELERRQKNQHFTGRILSYMSTGIIFEDKFGLKHSFDYDWIKRVSEVRE